MSEAPVGSGAATVASDRYSTSLAPRELLLTQELLNSQGQYRPRRVADLLGDVGAAQEWLTGVLRAWTALRGLEDVRLELSATALRELRSLRQQLRDLLAGTATAGRAPLISTRAHIEVTPGAASLRPSGAGATYVGSAVAIEWVLGRANDGLRRIKLCRSGECGVSFYDRSKNNSRIWHDPRTCGNVANVRAFRERQRP